MPRQRFTEIEETEGGVEDGIFLPKRACGPGSVKLFHDTDEKH